MTFWRINVLHYSNVTLHRVHRPAMDVASACSNVLHKRADCWFGPVAMCEG